MPNALWCRVSVSVECWTDSYYNSVWAVAWAAIGVYAFGMLALNAVLLFLARHAIATKKPTRLSTAISFLHRDYERHIFMWELVEMVCIL